MNDFNPAPDNRPRLASLRHDSAGTPRRDGGYSAFIRSMRITLPLTALAIIAVLFSWNTLGPDDIAPAKSSPGTTTAIGQNELLNPKFDSVDNKNQPYTITAARALGGRDGEVMLLEGPMADIMLGSGNWLAVKSRRGSFRQESGQLLLTDDVRLFHDQGYSVKTAELDVDLRAGAARSTVKTTGSGPAGTFDAGGLFADTKTDRLVLTGPAKIVLYGAGGSISGGLLAP